MVIFESVDPETRIGAIFFPVIIRNKKKREIERVYHELIIKQNVQRDTVPC